MVLIYDQMVIYFDQERERGEAFLTNANTYTSDYPLYYGNTPIRVGDAFESLAGVFPDEYNKALRKSTKKQVFFNVILLQVVKRIVPPLGNEMMTLVKDTSLARVIACKEIIMIAQEYISVKGLIWPLFYSGLFYLLFCGALTVILGRVEKKLDYFRV